MPLADDALEHIRRARVYTLRLLADLEPDDWFRQPAEGVTHIAWQVGHIAMAQYRLTLDRLRGERPEDATLIAPEFLARFAKGSTPEADPGLYPTPTEIRATLDRVFEQTLREVPAYSDARLAETVLKPHPLFSQKIDSLRWCADHELIHAGQIGLLRRLHGKAPQW